jgi:hypothetical protein
MLAMQGSALCIRTISTRRFFLRPESVSLLATGSGRAVTFRCQSRAVDTVVSQLVQNGACAISGEFPVGHQHFPPVGVAFYADASVGDYRICRSQSTRYQALDGPASIHEGDLHPRKLHTIATKKTLG